MLSWAAALAGGVLLVVWLQSLQQHSLFSIRRMRSIPYSSVVRPEEYAKLTALLVILSSGFLLLGGIGGILGFAPGPYIAFALHIGLALLGGRLDKNLAGGSPPKQ